MEQLDLFDNKLVPAIRCSHIGVTTMVLSGVITTSGMWQMVMMYKKVNGKRSKRSHELSQLVYGGSFGLWILLLLNIVCMAIGGISLKRFYNTACPSCKPIKTTYFIIIFGSIHFFLSHLSNFINSIVGFSLISIVMSLSFVLNYLLLVLPTKPAWLGATVDMFDLFHFIACYQLFRMPVFHVVEACLVKKMNFKPTRLLSIVTHTLYVSKCCLFPKRSHNVPWNDIPFV